MSNIQERNSINNKLITKLEKLLMSEDLEELSNSTNKFNIFNALRLQNNEIRHSNFLAWLMSPHESHKLKDYFLKEFLKSALRNYSLDNNTEIFLSDLAFFNLDDAEIKREYKNVDILIISKQSNFVCIIENKIWTGEHDCQLEKYADIANNEYSDYKKMYIYLSPNNNDNCELMERKINNKNIVSYIPMNYKQVFDVLKKVLRFKKENMGYDTRIFIEHYVDMLERNIMGETDKKIIDLCRKIYREHKEAINLIIENNNYKTDVYRAMIETIKDRDDLQEINIEKNSIIALPDNIKNLNQFKYGAWTNDIIVYIHFINFAQGHKDACVELLVAPSKNESDNNKRTTLLNKIEEKTNLKFKGGDWSFTQPFSIITYEECLNYDNYDEIKNHIKQKMEELKTNYIDNLRKALNEI